MQPKPLLFSIIIPTYARPKQLAVCLEAIACLNYPRDRFEVIVVDDGSEAPPEHVVKSFSERLRRDIARAAQFRASQCTQHRRMGGKRRVPGIC